MPPLMNEKIMSSTTTVVALVAAIGGFCASMVLSSLLLTTTSKKDSSDDSQEKDNNNKTTTLLLNIIQQRRSIFPKQYSTKVVPRHIVEEMLEGARWAPTHKLTEPWEYIIYESLESRKELGQFLADRYKESCTNSGKEFSKGKYDKKLSNAMKSSYVIAIVCNNHLPQKNPIVEEICSVAMSVQNMLLIASAHKIGAYWSSGSVHEKTTEGTDLLVNPIATREFLGWNKDDNTKLFLGWIFVGDYWGEEKDDEEGKEEEKRKKKWPEGRRKETSQQRISWK